MENAVELLEMEKNALLKSYDVKVTALYRKLGSSTLFNEEAKLFCLPLEVQEQVSGWINIVRATWIRVTLFMDLINEELQKAPIYEPDKSQRRNRKPLKYEEMENREESMILCDLLYTTEHFGIMVGQRNIPCSNKPYISFKEYKAIYFKELKDQIVSLSKSPEGQKQSNEEKVYLAVTQFYDEFLKDEFQEDPNKKQFKKVPRECWNPQN